MITVTIIAGALLLGYILTVATFFVLTFGIASAAPAFAVQQYRIGTGYKLLQDFMWLICTFFGALAAAFVTGVTYPIVVAAVLATILVSILWVNTWEARQRGLPHQILISIMTLIGVAVAFTLYAVLFQTT